MTRPPKAVAVERIQRLIDQIPSLKSQRYDNTDLERWRNNLEVAIRNTFVESAEKLHSINSIRYSSGLAEGLYDQRAYLRGLDIACARLLAMLDEIEEYWEDVEQTSVSSHTSHSRDVSTASDVFVIHGHDHGTKETVARFLQGLDLEPIILHEQPNQGRTIIEKFEEYAQVGYAVVLLTPDDVGGSNSDDLAPRARQNVILELGFFLGQLGRGKVAALVKSNLEIPSDYSGVLYIPLDENDGWQMKLARELKAAEFDIDLNKLA